MLLVVVSAYNLREWWHRSSAWGVDERETGLGELEVAWEGHTFYGRGRRLEA